MRILNACSVFAAMMTVSTAVFAQTPAPLPPEPEGVTLTPFIGTGFGGDLESAPVSFGGALGYGLTTKLAVEGELFFEPNGTQGDVVEFDTHLWGMSANVLYHFTGKQVTPYVAGGLGFINADSDLESVGLANDDTTTQFAWNWGGGIKSALSDRYGVRADLRYITGDDLAPSHWRLYGGVVIRNIGQ
jgi:opacity protein-like surface antigen